MKKIINISLLSTLFLFSYNISFTEIKEMTDSLLIEDKTETNSTSTMQFDNNITISSSTQNINREDNIITNEIIQEEITIANYNEIIRNIFSYQNALFDKDTLNKYFEYLCAKIKPELIEKAKIYHTNIINNINAIIDSDSDLTKEFESLNSNIYSISYIFTQNNLPKHEEYFNLKNKILLAGYSLGESYKNKGEQIPNVSNNEFLSKEDEEHMRGKYIKLRLNSKDNKIINGITIDLNNNSMKNKLIAYADSQLANHKILFSTIREAKRNGFLDETNYYKGFTYERGYLSIMYISDKSCGIYIDNIKENIVNVYPIYSHEKNIFDKYTIQFIDKWEKCYDKNLFKFLNKYKIGEKLNTKEDVEFEKEIIINNTPMYKFSISKTFNELKKIHQIEEVFDGNIVVDRTFSESHDIYEIEEAIYDFSIYVDKNTKIIKIIELTSRNNRNIYDALVMDVYGIETYYGSDKIGQKIIQKNNQTIKYTRVKYSSIFNQTIFNLEEKYSDIITSLSKIKINMEQYNKSM